MPVSPVPFIAGIALILLAGVETISTAVRVDHRGGPVTRWVSAFLWRGFRGGGTRRREGPPSWTGVVITVAIVLTWGVLALAGWFLLFSSDTSAVVGSRSGQPADGWARLYFTGYTLSTLGMGDYVPAGAPWQVLTALASGFGFGTATLVITYLAGVVSAVTAKRQLARSIWGLGRTAQQVVARAWDGQRFTVIEQHLLTLGPMLHGVAEQHLAYPLIAYFRSSRRETADLPAIALLHDTLAILSAAEDRHRPNELVSAPAYEAIDAYLHALPGATRRPEDMDAPPWPDVTGLQEEGLPVRPLSDLPPSDDALFRRKRIGALMHHQGWAWRDLEEATGRSE